MPIWCPLGPPCSSPPHAVLSTPCSASFPPNCGHPYIYEAGKECLAPSPLYLQINTGLPYYKKVKESEVAQPCLTLCDPMDCSPPRLLCPRDFSGKSPGVGCHFHLQGIFLTQGSNLGLLHCRQILHHLSHQGIPYSHSSNIPITVTHQISVP